MGMFSAVRTRLRSLKEDAKAWRRGERRIAPAGLTGRVYERKEGPSAPAGAHKARAKATATLEMKITRADGSVEFVRVPATATQV